jgi:ABC-type branched-subunit amino acid transport system ATPase component
MSPPGEIVVLLGRNGHGKDDLDPLHHELTPPQVRSGSID